VTRKTSGRGAGRPRKRDRPGGLSRAELLDAAVGVFAERGFAAASVEQVIARAELSKGTFYSMFAGKSDLFLAVVEERLDRPARALMDLTATAPADTPTSAVVSAGLADLLGLEGTVILLLDEYRGQAARDEGLAERYRARQAALREALASALEDRHRHTGVPLTIAAGRLAEAFIALGHGLAVEAIVDPDHVDTALYGDILALVYDGLAARAHTATDDRA
jgi:AcrR family transcriptional regulator